MRERDDRLRDRLDDLRLDIRIPRIVIPRIRIEPWDLEVPRVRVRVPSVDLSIPDVDFPDRAWARDLGHDLRVDLRAFTREMRDFGRDMERFGREWRDDPPHVSARRHRPL